MKRGRYRAKVYVGAMERNQVHRDKTMNPTSSSNMCDLKPGLYVKMCAYTLRPGPMCAQKEEGVKCQDTKTGGHEGKEENKCVQRGKDEKGTKNGGDKNR